MSHYSNTFTFRAILKIGGQESYIDMHVPFHYTVRNLMDFIRNQLLTYYSSRPTNMYYLLHEAQIEMNEETRLGGVLLPEDTLLMDSIMERDSFILIESEVIPLSSPLSAGEEEKEEINDNDQINQINNFSQQLQNLIQPSVPLHILDIDEQVRVTDLTSLFNTFLRQDDIIQVRNPRANLMSLLSGYSMNQFSSDISLLSTLLRNPSLYGDVVVGLDKKELDELSNDTYAKLKVNNKHKLDTCSICFENFKDEDICRELKCCHMFHTACVDTWLAEHITCPVCREETGKGVPKL